MTGEAKKYDGIPSKLNIRDKCPYCRDKVSFEIAGTGRDLSYTNEFPGCREYMVHTYGYRTCPNLKCQEVIFFEHFQSFQATPQRTGYRLVEEKLVNLYPSAFNLPAEIVLEKIPETIRWPFKEAMECFTAGGFTACCIMLRKTLEEICLLEGINTGRLIDKVKMLQHKISLPQLIFDSMQQLRFFNSETGHLDFKDFINIGRLEARQAILIVVQIIINTYQFKDMQEGLQKMKTRPKPV